MTSSNGVGTTAEPSEGLGSLAEEASVERFRPVPESRGPLRTVRGLIGIVEGILAWTPEERTRFSWQGLIVFFTASVAMVSMGFFLWQVFGTVVVIPVAVLWGALIFSLDAWLISSTHGVVRGTKFLLFVPRLILAGLVAFVIAEPLILQVFHTEIDRQVIQTRQKGAEAYESLLERCNPKDGSQSNDPGCADHQLNVAGSPAGAQAELNLKKKQRDDLINHQIKPTEKNIDHLEKLARDECDGTGGSHKVGEGPNCRRNRQKADVYTKDSGVQKLRGQLVQLNTDISNLGPEIEKNTENYQNQLHLRIENEVAVWKGNVRQVGVLEKIKALNAITSGNISALVALWLLRMLLVVVECTPVLTKVLGGGSKYDKLVAARLSANGRVYQRELDALTDVQMSRIDMEEARAKEGIAQDLRAVKEAERERELSANQKLNADKAAQQAELAEMINAYAARIRGSA